MLDEENVVTKQEEEHLAQVYTERQAEEKRITERAVSAYRTVRSYYVMCWHAAFIAGLWCGIANRDMMQFSGSAVGACLLLLTSQVWAKDIRQLIIPVIVTPIAVWIVGSLFGWSYAGEGVYGCLGVLLFVLLAWMTSFVLYVIRHWRTPLTS